MANSKVKHSKIPPGSYPLKLEAMEQVKKNGETKQLKLIYKSKNPKYKNIKFVAVYSFK